MTTQATARSVILSYPADLSDWGRGIVEGTPFRAYLRRAHDVATVGDEWAEFVGVGCCGDALDVPLRVEAVMLDGADADGDVAAADPPADSTSESASDSMSEPASDSMPEPAAGRIVDGTTFSFEERAACGIAGGWAVQSESGG
jgi:hypothetical protein